MREIKFRAWNELEQKMSFWTLNDLLVNFGYTELDEKPSVLNDEFMQYIGLKDKNGVAEVYEGDIIDTYGNIKGNIYEMDKRETDLVIQGFGTSSWEATNKEAMARGLKYSE